MLGKNKHKKQKSARELDAERIRAERITKKKKKSEKVKKPKVRKTVQQTLPYISFCDNYILEVEPNRYSKTYKFDDLNYAIASNEEQESGHSGHDTQQQGQPRGC